MLRAERERLRDTIMLRAEREREREKEKERKREWNERVIEKEIDEEIFIIYIIEGKK